MAIKLFYFPGSCALAPHIALEEAELSGDFVLVDLAKQEQLSAEFLRINPKGHVPVLLHDKFVLTENLAVLRYISRLTPEKKLWPDNPREEASCIEWLSWLSSTLHPAYRHVLRPERFATGNEAILNVRTHGRVIARKYWEEVEKKLDNSNWLFGDHYTVADPYLLVYWMWGRGKTLGFDMSNDFPKWTAHTKRMISRPAVQRAFSRENIDLEYISF